MSAIGASRPGMLAPLTVRDFRWLFGGFVLGQAMMPLQFVTQIFWVQEHADPDIRIILIGVIGTMRGAGMLTFGLFGGALADRFDRRKLLMATQSTAFLLNGGIALLILLDPGETLGLVIFFLLTFAASAMFSVDGPTRQAMVPEVLGTRLTPAGIALTTAGMQLAMPISIFAVGQLIDQLGFAATYGLSTAGHVIEVLTLAMMSYRTTFDASRRTAMTAKRTLTDIAQGFRYTRSRGVLFWPIAILVLVMGLGMPPTANLGPTWVTTVVGASFSEFGFIALGWGGSALVTSLLLARFSHIEARGRLIGLGALLFVGAFVVFTVGHSWHFAVAGNLGLGTGMTMAQISTISVVAFYAPNEIRGRVMSLVMLSMGVAQAMTLPIAVVGQEVSLQTLFPILSISSAVLVGGILAFKPFIWSLRVPRVSEVGQGPLEATPAPAGD